MQTRSEADVAEEHQLTMPGEKRPKDRQQPGQRSGFLSDLLAVNALGQMKDEMVV